MNANGDASSEQVDNCPDPAELKRFAVGALAVQEQIERIGEHLNFCTQCLELVAQTENAIELTECDDFAAEGLDPSYVRSRWNEFQSEAIPNSIGKYHVDGILARGGMSVVYHSTHPALGKPVVIKALPFGRLLSVKARERMIAEQRILGTIDHPCVVTALDADVDDGIPFIVLERLSGKSLAESILERKAFSVEDASAIILCVADVLETIHNRGMVHRDVKPGNIILTEDGTVKLLDFGLAFFHASEDDPTGTCVGTPSFMSPEQADASQQVDHRADLFSLGRTFQALLGADKNGKCSQSVPRELKSLIARLVAEKRQDRPSCASEVVSALQPYARKSTLVDIRKLYRQANGPHWRSSPNVKRWIFPGILILAAACFTLLALRWKREFTAKPIGVELQKHPAETDYPRPFSKITALSPDASRIACFGEDGLLRIFPFESGKLGKPALIPCYESTDVELPPLVWLSDQLVFVSSSNREPTMVIDANSGDRVVQRQFDSEVTVACFDQRRDQLVLGLSDGNIGFYTTDLEQKSSIELLSGNRIEALALHENLLVAASSSGAAILCEASSSKLLKKFQLEQGVYAAAWHPQGHEFFLGTENGEVLAFDLAGNKLEDQHIQGRGIVRSLGWHHEGKLLAVGSWDSFIWDFESQSPIELCKSNISTWSHFAWHRNDLIMCSADMGMLHWNSQSHEQIALLPPSNQQVVSIAWSSANNRIAVATRRGDMFLLDEHGRYSHATHTGEFGLPFNSLAWSTDGEKLAAIEEWTQRLKVFDSQLVEQSFLLDETRLRALVWLSERTIAYAGMDGHIGIFDLESGNTLESLDVSVAVNWLDFNREQSRLLASTESDGLRIIKLQTDGKLSLAANYLPGVRLSNCIWTKGNQVIAADRNYRLLRIDADTGEVLQEFPTLGTVPRALTLSPTGEHFSCGNFGVFLTKNLSRTMTFIPAKEYAYAWSTDGKSLATGNWVDEVSVWDLSAKSALWRGYLPPSPQTKPAL